MAQLSMQNLKTAFAQNNTKMKQWVESQISAQKTFDIQWVDVLPATDISTSTIYMLKDISSTKENNIYIEYVYKEDGGWEIIGSIDAGSINLEDYYNKEETEALIATLKETLMEAYTDDEIITMVDEVWSE